MILPHKMNPQKNQRHFGKTPRRFTPSVKKREVNLFIRPYLTNYLTQNPHT